MSAIHVTQNGLPSMPEVDRMLAERDIDPCTDDLLAGLILDMGQARFDGDAVRETVAILAYVRRAVFVLQSAAPADSLEARYSAELQRLEDIGMWDVTTIGTGGNCTAVSASVGMVGKMGCYMLATLNGEPTLEADSVPLGKGEASARELSSMDALEAATQRALRAAREYRGQAQRVTVNGSATVARIDDSGVHFDGGY